MFIHGPTTSLKKSKSRLRVSLFVAFRSAKGSCFRGSESRHSCEIPTLPLAETAAGIDSIVHHYHWPVIGERPVDCIRIEADGQWVGDLFFDKETHLLVASKKQLFDDTIGKSRVSEAYYSAYMTVDGLNLPMCIKAVIDGETTTTITVTDVKFMNEIDDGVFAKPVKRK